MDYINSGSELVSLSPFVDDIQHTIDLGTGNIFMTSVIPCPREWEWNGQRCRLDSAREMVNE